MAQGQGARTALPIHGIFYKKIYADPEIKLKDDGVFDVPEGFDPCGNLNQSEIEFEETKMPPIGIDDMFD